MLSEVNEKLRIKYLVRGQKVPTEQPKEEFYEEEDEFGKRPSLLSLAEMRRCGLPAKDNIAQEGEFSKCSFKLRSIKSKSRMRALHIPSEPKIV